MSFVDVIVFLGVLLIGHQIAHQFAQRYNAIADGGFFVKLFYYHLGFSLLFAAYVTIFGGDSLGYWKHPGRFWTDEGWIGLHRTGTPFVYFLTYPFSQVLSISFWGGTVLFSLFGYTGTIFLYLTLRRVLKANPKLFGFPLLQIAVLLPNMHFWSGGIGKDSVIFFALCLFVFSLTNLQRSWAMILFSFYLAFFIRPHIAMVMLIASGLAVLLSSKGMSVWWRITFVAAAIAVFVIISPIVFDFIGIDDESIDNYEDIANIRSKNLSRSNVGSRIDIATMSVPLRMFTFLYRPLFFDAGNLLGIIVSIENLFYLILTFTLLKWRNIIRMYEMPLVLKTCLFFSISTAYFMSSSLSNLGIIIRQKNMVMFMLVILFLYLRSEDMVMKRRHSPKGGLPVKRKVI